MPPAIHPRYTEFILYFHFRHDAELDRSQIGAYPAAYVPKRDVLQDFLVLGYGDWRYMHVVFNLHDCSSRRRSDEKIL